MIDADGDGRLTRDELIYGLPLALAGSPSLAKMLDLPADELAATKAVDFSELSNASGTPFKIADTAERAVTLSQLRRIFAHAKKRVRAEKWVGDRRIGDTWTTIGPLLIDEVNLYDTLKYVIKPATLKHKCSLVEMMADGVQLPDYFISHCASAGSIRRHLWDPSPPCLPCLRSPRGVGGPTTALRRVGRGDCALFRVRHAARHRPKGGHTEDALLGLRTRQ